MKILQCVYSGLGGVSNVAFAIINGSKRKQEKYNFQILFYGVEQLLNSHKLECKLNNTKYIYIKKKKFFNDLKLIKSALKLIRPKIIFLHDQNIIPFLMHKFIYKTKIIYIHHTPDNTKRFIDWIMYIINSKCSDKVILVSKRKKSNSLNILNKFINVKPKVILNGVEIQSKKKIKDKKIFTIGMAARFVNDKYQKNLINVFANNINFFKKNNIILKLAGNGDTLNACKQIVNERKISENVIFDGSLGKKKLNKWFQEIDLYIHLSKGETSSTSILQALSNGLPIVCTKIEGNLNLLRYYKQTPNLYFTNNSEKSIFKNIKLLFENKVLQFKLGNSAHQSVKKYFNIEKMFDEYYKVIKSLFR